MKIGKPARLISMLIILVILITGCTGHKLQDNTGDGGSSAGPVTDPADTAGDDDAGEETPDPAQGTTGPGEQTAGEGGSGDPAGEESAGDEADNAGEGGEERVKVRALYLTGWTVGNSQKVEHYVELANTTEINAYVVDIKDDDGYVGYESQVPEVRENNTWKKKYNPEKVLKEFHDNGIYVIGRLVVFKDPVYSERGPIWPSST